MVPPPQHRNQKDAVRSRDEALGRIRRATVTMGLTASMAAVGIGVAVAGASTHHVSTANSATGSTTSATGAPVTTSTTGASGASSPSSGSSAPTTPTTPTTPKATTTSGQS